MLQKEDTGWKPAKQFFLNILTCTIFRFCKVGHFRPSGYTHTVFIIDVSADDIFDPGEVGRGASEHRWLLVHNASNGAKTGYAMNFPRAASGILAHQGTTWISLKTKVKFYLHFIITFYFNLLRKLITSDHITVWNHCNLFGLCIVPDRQIWAHQAGYNRSRSWSPWPGTTSSPSACMCHMAQQVRRPG